MRPEVAPFAIRVALIEPGAVRTRFLANSELHAPEDDGDGPYAAFKANVAKMTARAHRDGARGVLDPGDVAKVIVKAVTARRPKARYKVGSQARIAPVARLARITPETPDPADSRTSDHGAWRGGCSPAVSVPDGCGMILIERRVDDRGHDISCCSGGPGLLMGSGP